MISPGGLVATFFKAATQVSAAVDAAFNYVSLLLNGEPAAGTSTFLTDASVNASALTPTGAVRPDNFSPFAGDGYYSTQLATAGDTISVPMAANSISAPGDFTIEFWIYPTASGNIAYLTKNGYSFLISNAGTAYGLYLSSTGTVWDIANTTAGTVVYNAWTHIALVRSGTTFTFYQNGINVKSIIAATNLYDVAGTLYSGYWNAGAATFSAAGFSISNLRVVKGTAVYTSNFTVPTSPLTAISGTSLLTCQSSRVVDKSANAFAITATGTPKVSYNQPIGSKLGSVKFNGTTDYLTLPASAQYNLTGDFTVETWVYLNTLLPGNDDGWGGPTILSMSNGGNASTISADLMISLPRPSQGATPTTWLFSGVGGAQGLGAVQITGGTPVANSWTHVALTRSGTTVRAFVNGTQIGTATSSAAFGSSTHQMFIGAFNYTYLRTMNGYVSNTRVVNGTALYTAAFTPSTSPLTAVANTALLTCQGNVLDASTNALTVTTTGTPSASYASPFPQTVSLPSTYGSGYFNGSTDGITYTGAIQPQGTENFTIEFWAYKNSAWTAANKMFFDNNGSGALMGIWLAQTAGMLRLSVAGGAAILDYGLGNFSANQWYHIAYTRVGNVFTLYVNGTSVATNTTAAVWGTSTSSTIGVIAAGNAYYFDGHISNFRVVRGTAVYTGNFTPPTAPLTAVAGTSLLALQSTTPASTKTVMDSSPLDNVITVAGTPGQGTFSPFSQGGWSTYFNGAQGLTFPLNHSAFDVGANDFTVECWINPIQQSLNGLVFTTQSDWATAAGSGWSCQVSNGSTVGSQKSSLYVGATAYQVNSPNTPAGQWSHVAWVRNGSNWTSYINGALYSTVSGVTGSVNIGATNIGPRFAWQGAYLVVASISNFRIVKGTALYTGATYTVPTGPLTAIPGTSLLICQNNRMVDNSPNAVAITYTGTPSVQAASPWEPAASWSPAANGSSIYYNGTTDYLTASNALLPAFGTGDFTVETWVYPTAASQASFVCNNYNWATATGNWCFYCTTGSAATMYFNAGGANHASSTTTTIPLNQWTHIAYSRSGTVGYFFINGVQLGTSVADTTSYLNAAGTLYVGDKVGAGGKFTGYMADTRVTGGTAVYTKSFTLPTAPLQPLPGTALLLKGTPGIVDAAGKNNITTVGSAATANAIKKYGTSSLSFPTTTDYIKMANNQGLNFGTGDFTIECWLYRTSSATTGRIFQTADGGVYTGINLYVLTATNAIGLAMSSDGVNWTIMDASVGTLTNNVWTHLAVVRSGTTIKVYLNGTQSYSGTIGASVAPYYSATQTPIVGGSSDNTGFIGYIDDFRITKGAARYTANFTPPTQAFGTN